MNNVRNDEISAYFRCDFGSNYGLGHLMRCISLAQEFQKYSNFKTYCLTNSFSEKYQALLQISGMSVIQLASKSPGLGYNLDDYADMSRECLTIFDNYDVTFEQMVSYKERAPNLVAIDDMADRLFNVDMIVNTGIKAKELSYRALNNPTLLLGPEYVLLRNKFLKSRRAPNRHEIFMSFGGGDVASRIKPFLQMFHAINEKLNDDIVINFALDISKKQTQSVQSIFKGLDKIRVNYISQSYDLSSVMAQADFAITAGGSTVFELASLGVPQLIFFIDKNQELAEQVVNEKGFGFSLGYIWNLSENDFIKYFFEFLSNNRMKDNMSKKGQEFIDGKGAERVVKGILNYYNWPANHLSAKGVHNDTAKTI